MRIKSLIIFLIAILGFQVCHSQESSQRLNLLISSRVDTTSTDVKKVVKLYENYYNSKPDSIYNNPYWNKVEKEKYTDFDFSRSSIFQGNMTPKKLFEYYSPFVMSVEPIGKKYQIRVLFSSPTTDPEYAGSKVWTIQKLNAIKENGKWVLENLIVEITKNWSFQTFGKIEYHYPPDHQFNQEKANKAKAFTQQIITRFNPGYDDVFKFYITDNIDEMGLLSNFDYYFVGITTGFTRKNTIFSAKGNEYYPHEFVHQLLPKNKNRGYLVEEGLATFLGSKESEADYDKLLGQLASDVVDQPKKMNFESIISQKVGFNGYQTAYPAGAALCELVYNEKKDEGLLKLMKSNTKDYENIIKSVGDILQMAENEIKKEWLNILKMYNK